MNTNQLAQSLLNRRNRMNPIIMQGEMQAEVGADGMQEALQRRWLVPNMESGCLQVSTDMNKVLEMRKLAEQATVVEQIMNKVAEAEPPIAGGARPFDPADNPAVDQPNAPQMEPWMEHILKGLHQRFVEERTKGFTNPKTKTVYPPIDSAAAEAQWRELKPRFEYVISTDPEIRERFGNPAPRGPEEPQQAEPPMANESHKLTLAHAHRNIDELLTMGVGASHDNSPQFKPQTPSTPTGGAPTANKAMPNVGDEVMVAEAGKTYTGRIGAVNNGAYKVNFGNDKPPVNRDYKPNEFQVTKQAVPNTA